MCWGGGWGGGECKLYIPNATLSPPNSAFRWAAMRAILMPHLSLTVRVGNATPVQKQKWLPLTVHLCTIEDTPDSEKLVRRAKLNARPLAKE